jgi:hypothetical protein
MGLAQPLRAIKRDVSTREAWSGRSRYRPRKTSEGARPRAKQPPLGHAKPQKARSRLASRGSAFAAGLLAGFLSGRTFLGLADSRAALRQALRLGGEVSLWAKNTRQLRSAKGITGLLPAPFRSNILRRSNGPGTVKQWSRFAKLVICRIVIGQPQFVRQYSGYF